MKHPGVECDSVEQEAVTMTSVSDTHLDLQYTNRLQMHTHTHVLINVPNCWSGHHQQRSDNCDQSSCDRERKKDGKWKVPTFSV